MKLIARCIVLAGVAVSGPSSPARAQEGVRPALQEGSRPAAHEGPRAAAPQGPAAAERKPRAGEVTGSDVYVRSGASLNHYPVIKLAAGERVQIVGETAEWYEVLPPAGTFSLISEQYVETADQKRGIVNGDNVRVRAGSTLDDRLSTTQVKLSKGAEVTILGRNDNGYYRIVPPAGATLWISRQFVEIVPEALIDLERGMTSRPSAPTAAAEDGAVRPADDQTGRASTPATSPPPPPVDPLELIPESSLREELIATDRAMQAEIKKPLMERSLPPILARYDSVARQTDDDFARTYAESRMRQLGTMADLIDAVARVRKLNEQSASMRKASMQGRTGVGGGPEPIPPGFDAVGQLRRSAVYSLPVGVQRYRLVEPAGDGERTIGYVIIPRDSRIEVDALLGRVVGIRAIEKRLQSGLVDPVPVYVAAEIIPVASDDGGASAGGAEPPRPEDP